MIATLISVNGILIRVPSISVITKLESAPDSSVKNLLFLDSGSDILNTALPSSMVSVKSTFS